MRLVVFAWCPTSIVQALVQAGANVTAVVTGNGLASEGMTETLRAMSIPLVVCADVNASSFVERIRGFEADLLVVAGCGQRLREPVRRAARLGAINVHPSLLPHYRGKEPLFWMVLHGESRAGVTVHVMTDALDEGPILFQGDLAVPPRATARSLAKLVDEAACRLVPEIVACARSGLLPRGRSPADPGSHHPALNVGHGRVGWAQSAMQIDRHVRACTGYIDPYALVRGVKLVIEEAEPMPQTCAARPGEIVAREGNALVVAAGDGCVRLLAWRWSNGAHTPEELAAWLPLSVGMTMNDDD
jgi:UDP-4-amino-4-deoxy-L-arabinose formyltransferase/UDP-glucuronic acid dehydrogenase (UDP-4-keto-hexauronic acid decarboxylating)